MENQLEEELQDLKDRYEFIGGLSPLAGTTDRQAEALLDALNKERDDVNFKLYLGLKHISPYIEEAVEQMHNDGIKEAVTVVLAPHYSSFLLALMINVLKKKQMNMVSS